GPGAAPQPLRQHEEHWRLDVPGERAARSLSAPAIVIATGTRFAGEEWLDAVANARRIMAAGRLHLGATAVGEQGADLGSHVAVIGGGDNAFDVSRMLAGRGIRGTVVMRSKLPKAQPLLIERLRRYQASGLVTVLAERTVAALEEVDSRVGIRLQGGGEIEADRVVLLFGYRPNTDQPWLVALAPATNAL